MAVTVQPTTKGTRKSRLQRKHRFLGSVTDVPTHNENLLYLLAELEGAVGRPAVEWSGDLVAEVCRRLEQLVQVVRQITSSEP